MNNKRVVLITGCSSGFGLLISKILSTKKDIIVCSTMRNLNKQGFLLNEVKKVGGNIDIFELDITKKDSIENCVNSITTKYGKIDVLVNNAGQAFGGFFEDLTEEEYRLQMEINFFGQINLIRKVLPNMHKNKSGKIINISSIAGLISYPGLGAYNSSKWAFDGFSESLRHELSPFGIKVFLIEPGSFDTRIFGENAKFAKNYKNIESKYYNWTSNMITDRVNNKNKKRGNPEKVATIVVDIIENRRKKFRNIIGIDARVSLFCKIIFPFCFFEKIVQYFAYYKK